MSSRNLLLLLVIIMTQNLDMGVSNPLYGGKCHWNEFKNLTQSLYSQALKIYHSTNSTKNTVLDDIPRIQCSHECGPKHLVSDPKTCLRRIFHVLSYYKSALSILETSRQNQDFTKVNNIVSAILKQLQVCGCEDSNPTVPKTKNLTPEFLKMKIGSPLLSVSILIARVFSPGNPSHHTLPLRH